MIITIEIPNAVRQVIPVLIGAMLSVSFGMMLGWASVSYPFLLRDDVTPIHIEIGQTALIAGFLWEGNVLGVLFSTSKHLPCKLAVCLCFLVQIAGWILMFYSQNIWWFVASRGSIGFGHGYGMGQLKRYIKDTCDRDIADRINTHMPLGMATGVLLMFLLGSNVDFRANALYSIVLPAIALLLFALIPKYEKPAESENRINNMMSVQNKNDLSKGLKPLEQTRVKPYGVFQVIRDRESRNVLLVKFLLVFLQQYGGGAANIVYSQIIFTSTKNPHPKISAIIYATGFVISMAIALKYAKKVKRKTNLLSTIAACILLLSLISCYYYLRHDLIEISEYFVYGPLFLLVTFNFFHTFGLATVPLLLLKEKLPVYSSNIGGKFWTINFSLSAVISTKIFQVLYTNFGMAIAYLLFVCVLLAGFIIICFIPDFTPVEETSKPNTIESGQVNIAYEVTEDTVNDKPELTQDA